MMDAKVLCPNCMAQVEGESEVCPFCNEPFHVENQEYQLAVGAILENRYLVGRAIGGGGFGIVYVGYDITLESKVAIKEYYPAGAANRDFDGGITPLEDGDESFQRGRARFRKEAELMSFFTEDKNIVSVKDVFDANGTSYIVMEFIEGQDLTALLRQHGRFTLSQAMELTEPIRQCLGRIHEKGVVHCDVSPSNIILSSDGVLKLLDFGAARRMDEREEQGAILKHGYAPEELYRPDGECGPWTDVYAFSAVLYKLITDELPDAATDRLFQDNLKKPSKLGGNLTKAQEKGLMKGLSLQAKDRPQSMAALLEEINKKMEKKEWIKIGLCVFFVAVLAICIGIAAAGGVKSSSPTVAARAMSSTGSTASTRERPEQVVLAENAYPVRVFAEMEPVESFEPQYLLNNDYVSCKVDKVLYGNRQLCLLATYENKTTQAAVIYPPALEAPNDSTIYCDYSRTSGVMDLDSKETREVALWWNTDELYKSGLFALQTLDFSVWWSSDADVKDESSSEYENDHFLCLPKVLRLEGNYPAQPTEVFAGRVEGGDLTIGTFGCSLRRDHYEGLLLLDCTLEGYPTSYSDKIKLAELKVTDVLADGKALPASVSSDSFSSDAVSLYCYSRGDTEKKLFLRFPYERDTVKIDEMNVMHTGKALPKEIELKLGLSIFESVGSGEYKEIATLRFSIDENGEGHLIN